MENYIPDRAALMQEAYSLIAEMSDEDIKEVLALVVPRLLVSINKKLAVITALL